MAHDSIRGGLQPASQASRFHAAATLRVVIGVVSVMSLNPLDAEDASEAPSPVSEATAAEAEDQRPAPTGAEDPHNHAPGAPALQKEALARFNSLIGEWRGTGQPRRGSNQGAWRESAEWLWDFTEGDPALQLRIADGKLLTSGRLTFDPEAESFRLAMQTPESVERAFAGQLDKDRLVLETAADDGQESHRITLTLLNEKRTLLLFERRAAGQQNFARVAEVGYTREGTRLAVSGASGPECIVTGGEGTIAVTYNGKTYYVCCTGCQQAFEADPEGVIAEAAERRKKEAADREAAR